MRNWECSVQFLRALINDAETREVLVVGDVVIVRNNMEVEPWHKSLPFGLN